MLKIKAFNVVLTLAAFAALFFLLPADKDLASVTLHKVDSPAAQSSIIKKANQQTPVRGHFLHSV